MTRNLIGLRKIATSGLSLPGCLIFCGCLIVGCGSGHERLEVAGTVTLDGNPLDGAILFLPEGAGTPAGGKVVKGKFRIARDKGLSPGAYRVEIVSHRPTGRMRSEPPGVEIEELEQILPARYNRDSTLRVEIDAEGAERLAFQLSSSR